MYLVINVHCKMQLRAFRVLVSILDKIIIISDDRICGGDL